MSIFAVFLNNRNFISKIRRSKVTDYAALRGSTHKWINSWFSGRSQQVVLDGQASDPVLSVVPQIIKVNRILTGSYLKSSVCLFGDDCVLYRNIHSLQDCLFMQEDLDSLALWEADWQMKLNVESL